MTTSPRERLSTGMADVPLAAHLRSLLLQADDALSGLALLRLGPLRSGGHTRS
jgi:hypothetical protein